MSCESFLKYPIIKDEVFSFTSKIYKLSNYEKCRDTGTFLSHPGRMKSPQLT